MEISKKSWHYKLNKSMLQSFEADVWKGKVFTTCSYIWLTLFSLILAALFIVVGVAVALFAMTMILGMIGVPIAVIMGLKFESAIILHALGVGTIGWVVAIIMGFTFGLVSLTNWVGKTNTKWKHEKEYKASLMKQAIQDRKDGICTIVTFK